MAGWVCSGGTGGEWGGQGCRGMEGAAAQAVISPQEGARRETARWFGQVGGPHDPECMEIPQAFTTMSKHLHLTKTLFL